MTRTAALLAGPVIIAMLGGTWLAVQQRTEAACAGVAIAGGAIGGPFALVDQTGAPVTDSDVITKPSLIYFGYTFCPDVCPIDNARNAAAVDILAESGIDAQPVFVSVDPARDTVPVVADYIENFHPAMIGLTGSEEAVKDAANAYRVVYSRADDDPEFYLVSHSVFTYFVTPEDGFVTFFRREDSPEQIAETVSCLLAEG